MESCYCSPNVRIEAFRELLENIGDAIANTGSRKIIIGGDFNARLKLWDRKTNVRRRIMEEWLMDKEMTIINKRKVEICVRVQGSRWH